MKECSAGILVKQRQFLNQRIVFGGLMSLYIRHFSNNIKSPGELYFDRRENTPPWVYSHGIISAMFYHKVFGETSLSGEINMGRLYYVYTGLFSANLYSSWRHSHKWNLFFIAFNKSMVSECVFKRFAMLFCNGSYIHWIIKLRVAWFAHWQHVGNDTQPYHDSWQGVAKEWRHCSRKWLVGNLFIIKYAGKSTPRIDMSILGVLLPASTPVIPAYTPWMLSLFSMELFTLRMQMQPAYDRMQPACDRMQAAYDRILRS